MVKAEAILFRFIIHQKHLVPLLKLDPTKKEPQPLSLQIAGGIPVEGMPRINDNLIMDGNIGTRFLLN